MWTAFRINYETANRNNVVFRGIGRLRPGVSVERAQMQADRVAADLRKQFPIKQTAGLYFHVVPMFDDLVGDPWQSINDQNRDYYFNPLATDIGKYCSVTSI